MINLSEKHNLFIKSALCFFAIALLCTKNSFSQTLTDTIQHNKNAVIEEFTAVHCSFCPAGHRLLDSIINENPGRIISVAMHPANAPNNYTVPYSGSPDFRRSYLNAFFTMPFIHDSIRFFPGAFINRRQWSLHKREQFSNKWRQFTQVILNEQSPVNIGIAATYDAGSSQLSVDVEVYYTDNVSSTFTLYLFLSEDSLVAEQNNGGVGYIHNHVFRESLTQQWGDTIAVQANKRTIVTKHYTFNNSSSQYNISRCHLSACVRSAVNEEMVTGNTIKCNNIIVSVEDQFPKSSVFKVFPNPTTGFVVVDRNEKNTSNKSYNIEVVDITGKVLYTKKQFATDKINILDLTFLNKGIYLFRLSCDNIMLESKKFIKE